MSKIRCLLGAAFVAAFVAVMFVPTQTFTKASEITGQVNHSIWDAEDPVRRIRTQNTTSGFLNHGPGQITPLWWISRFLWDEENQSDQQLARYLWSLSSISPDDLFGFSVSGAGEPSAVLTV